MAETTNLTTLRLLARAFAILIGGSVGFLSNSTSRAHEGPPFPVLMDQSLAGRTVSLWADPDIGEATFYVIVEGDDVKQEQSEPTVSLWTEPVSGRLERVAYATQPHPQRNHLQYEAHPVFDKRDTWRVGVTLATDNGTTETITAEVESTPPGMGAWDLAIYLFPFALLGVAWIIAMARRRIALQRHIPIEHPRSIAASSHSGASAIPGECE
ncbi:hypothetical protein FYK55_12780 [Roseiconus nitratireducens]|uniref:Uncharacterized protein n=2 Tax=Roseiconus nitratireducens TaxID=2605748 RepID=A0A5M6D6M0_9BACT|nr:hypothetical protein FYK55_12780 [Roseiconus nitratireducens]